MNAAALGLYVVFAAVAFGWRTWPQWRRTGDNGLRLDAPTGTVRWWAKLAISVALAIGFSAPIIGLTGLDPIGILDASAIRASGVIVAIVGIAATGAAQWQMGASWRIGVDPEERTELVATASTHRFATRSTPRWSSPPSDSRRWSRTSSR